MTLHNDGGSARNIVRDLDAALTEAEWVSEIMVYAHAHHWFAAHFRPARTDKGYRTALSGDVGVPDIICARGGRVVLIECKAQGKKGTTTAYQRAWLEASGGWLFEPGDRATMEEVLR